MVSTPHQVLSIAAFGMQMIGFLLASYGLLRQSFAELAEKRTYGEGRFGEGVYGGLLTPLQALLVRFGKWTRLLASDEALTLTNRKQNASLAVGGVTFIALSYILEIGARYLGS